MGFGEIWHEEPLSTSELGVWEDNGLGEADLNILLHDKKRKRAPETNKAQEKMIQKELEGVELLFQNPEILVQGRRTQTKRLTLDDQTFDLLTLQPL